MSELLFGNIYDDFWYTTYINRNALDLWNLYEHKQNVTTILTMDLYIDKTFQEACDIIISPLQSPNVTHTEAGKFFAHDTKVFLEINLACNEPLKSEQRSVFITIHGNIEDARAYYEVMQTYKNAHKLSTVHWWFKAENGIDAADFPIRNDTKFYPEFYPSIPNVDEYIDTYNKSTANVLILLGEPGTGKTSFIRHMLLKDSTTAYTTYDEEVMQDDSIYIKFLKDSDVRYLILEDADLILTDRLHDNNKVMSRILNTADGLMSFKNKKIIFTANIRDTTKIDEALLRRGRCFDTLHFQALSYEDACKAAKSAKLKIPAEERSYTLAELFGH